MVVFTNHPLLPIEACDAIEALLRSTHPRAIPSFVRADSEGHAQVHAVSNPMEVAAAVAEVMRCGSWDESPIIRIEVDSEAFDVAARWVKDRAEARVSRYNRPRGADHG